MNKEIEIPEYITKENSDDKGVERYSLVYKIPCNDSEKYIYGVDTKRAEGSVSRVLSQINVEDGDNIWSTSTERERFYIPRYFYNKVNAIRSIIDSLEEIKKRKEENSKE